MMSLWRRLVRHRVEMTDHAEEGDAALVDAQERLGRFEEKAEKEQRRKVAQMAVDARRR